MLASDSAHLTKFEIGKQLGFTGEVGFTSMPQTTLVRAIANTKNTVEKAKMKTDWEGSSDKYARMISKWLIKLGLLERIPKEITVCFGGKTYTSKINHAFMITAQGLTALNRALGKSKHTRIPKNVFYEMLATKGIDREYLRTRRALILNYLYAKKSATAWDILRCPIMAKHNIDTTLCSIHDDVKGLINMGLDIEISGDNYKWRDQINEFIIPIPISTKNLTWSS